MPHVLVLKWMIPDPVITPEMFAQTLVEDYSLSPTYHSVIVKTIQEQLSDFKAHMVDMDWKPSASAVEISPSDESRIEEPEVTRIEEQNTHEPVDDVTQKADVQDDSAVIMRGTMDEEEIRWWESWQKRCTKHPPARTIMLKNRRKKRKVVVNSSPSAKPAANDDSKPRTPNEFEIDENKVHEDLRILIKVRFVRRVCCTYFVCSFSVSSTSLSVRSSWTTSSSGMSRTWMHPQSNLRKYMRTN